MRVKDLKKAPLKRLIVVVNPDDFILEFSKKVLISRIEPQEKVVLWGDQWNRDLYLRHVGFPDILMRRKLVLVRRAEEIPEKELKFVRPSSGVHQLFLSRRDLNLHVDRRSMLYAKVQKPGYRESIEIVRFLFSQVGISLTDEEARDVFELLGRSLMDVWREAEKLSSLDISGGDVLKYVFPLERGGFKDLGEHLKRRNTARLLEAVKKAREYHIPPLYFLAILWGSAEKGFTHRLLDAERDIKLGADWTRLYRLVFEIKN